MQQTRIFLATQYDTLRQGLIRLLDTEPNVLVVGAVGGRIPDAVEIAQTDTHLLILDVRLLSPDAQALESLRQACPDVKVVVHAESDLIAASSHPKAVNVCTPRSLDSDDLLSIVQRIHATRDQ